jgi:hypothetical protein
VARKVARAVASGDYRIGPATVRRIRVDGKPRRVFDHELIDALIHGVVADAVGRAAEPTLSPALYSYRPGRSWADAVAALARVVRSHRRERPDPRDRGLYVLRRDIDAYTDSIPVDPSSRLWRQIADLFPSSDDRSGAAWDTLVDVVRPRIHGPRGGVLVLDRGVATGQPISCVLFNLYLGGIDRELGVVPGLFYARYSDDLILVHPDAAVARDVGELLDARLDELRLRVSPSKRVDAYLTGAGRPSGSWPEARGTTSVAFLGMRVGMDGGVSLGSAKVRRLLSDARRRARNAARMLRDASVDVRGRAVTVVLNDLLDPNETRLRASPASLLARMVTDRAQLDQLDHALARVVASAVTGDPGAAAFRRVPYRIIRGDWGLRSLRHARDRAA